MFRKWYAVKVKSTKQLDNGALRRTTERYLLEAVSFTDAETRVYKELGSVIRGEFSVTGIAPMNLHDIFPYDDHDTWYKVKVVYESMDAESEKAKNITQYMLVTAGSIKEAYERIDESLGKVLMVDFSMPDIRLSNIVEVFPIGGLDAKSVEGEEDLEEEDEFEEELED